jgi:outer membrane protein TolC
VTGGVNYDNVGYVNNSNRTFNQTGITTWNALLTLSYSIWDWGVSRHNVTIAEHKQGIDDNDTNLKLLSTEADMRKLMLDLSRLKANYSLNRELLELERQNYGYIESEYREGKVSYLDLINGLDNLLDAEAMFYTAHYDVLDGLVQYRYYEGTLYEALGLKQLG